MLFLLITWFLAGVSLWTIGTGLLYGLRLHCLERLGDRAIVATWLGALSLAALMLTISLVVPLSAGVGATVVGLSLILAWLRPETRRDAREMVGAIAELGTLWKGIMVGLAVAIAFLGSQTVYWSDTGLYHYQAISWFSQHGTVPGLALIHNRFSTNSSWFALVSPLNHGALTERICSVTGGFAYLLGISQLGLHLRRIIQHTEQKTDWFAAVGLFLTIPTSLKLTLPLSSSHDQPMIFMCIVCTWLLLHFSGNSPQHKNKGARLILIFSVLTTMVRLSAMPLMLMAAFFYFFSSENKFKALWQIPTISVVTLSPFLTFNALASGCLLYPLSTFCFNWSWAVGKERASEYQDFIREWNQWYFPWEIPDNPGLGEWILPWVQIEKPLLLLLIASVILLGVLLKSPRSLELKGKYYLVGVAVFGIIYTVYSAPSWRFCVGYACLLPTLYLSQSCARSLQAFWISILAVSAGANSWWGTSVSLTMVTLLTIGLAGWGYWLLQHPKNERLAHLFGLLFCLCFITPLRDYDVTRSHYPWVWQPWLPPTLSETYKTEGFTLETSHDVDYLKTIPDVMELCWGAEIPCTHELTHPEIRLRDPERGLSGGFVRVD
ncbi:MAG: hypothetical protein F6J87_27380 [Spirulina sp. SIO3F2]|nr:hypothetical protein [Spirulina sp. SIO3F2]